MYGEIKHLWISHISYEKSKFPRTWKWIHYKVREPSFIFPRNIFINHRIKSVAIYSPNDGAAAAAAKSLQSCPTLHDPTDGSPPDSPVPGILQARTLEWVAISFSSAWKWKGKVKSLSRVWDSSGPQGLQPTKLLCPWDSPGKSSGVDSYCLLL